MESQDWQNAIPTLIMLVVLVSSIILRRDISFKKMAIYLGLWSAVASVVVVVFVYRFELMEVKERVISGLNPRSARKAGNKLVIAASLDGHFHINTSINAKSVAFLVDTGASDLMLTLSDAKKIGIDPKKLSFNKIYQTANGKSFGASVILDSVIISGVEIQKVHASISNSDMGTSLLGMSFLRKFKRYEVYQDRMILEF